MKQAQARAAIERLEQFFAPRTSRAAILAREALGRPAAGDDAARAGIVAALQKGLRPDGSVGGAALPTIWRAIELMELGHAGQEPGTARLVTWVLGLAGKPGAFGEGCHPARHEQKACDHYLAGFFAPAPDTERLAPISLPCGKTFRAEAAARFAVSCLGLRAVLMAGLAGRASVKKHLTSLSLLANEWTDWGGYYAPDLIVSALHPLAISPPVHRGATLKTAAFIADNQESDGTWKNADFFHALESLMAAGTPPAVKAVAKAAPALVAMQRK
ncbi:MAG TPA: hypothetical protein VFV65_02045, partial [Gemmatimonadales bacterium]|nr:hypothetical protein [Gemmatimonadales bacterium]